MIAALGVGAPPVEAASASRAAALQRRMNALAGRISRAESARARTLALLRQTRASRARAAGQLERARIVLDALARRLYIMGSEGLTPAFDGRLEDVSDRLSYAEAVQRADRDVIERVAVAKRHLASQQGALADLERRQARAVAELRAQWRRLSALFREQQRLLARQRAIARASRYNGPVYRGRGPFEICPVDRPRAFTNDFGAPRYGGGYHRHQGIDILAPRGTPIRAPFDGRVRFSSSRQGGLQAYVYGRRGFVFNAHLNSFGRGGFVRAGTLIGTVGNSGNARGGPTHDHFEWHPGGGGAANPYSYLRAVC